MCCSECAEYSALDILNAHFSSLRIYYSLLLCLSEEPVHTVADARCDVDVFQESEVRKSDLEVMSHTILELVPEVRAVEIEFTCLEIDPVLKRGVVTE